MALPRIGLRYGARLTPLERGRDPLVQARQQARRFGAVAPPYGLEATRTKLDEHQT